MDDLPDIPALKAVRSQDSYGEASAYHALMSFMICLVTVQALLGAWDLAHKKPESGVQVTAVMVALMGVGLIVWLAMMVCADIYWETSEEGLLARGWLRKRFVRWQDIQSIGTERNRFNTSMYRLTTPQDVLMVRRSEQDARLLCLNVSVWQHLRREGRVDGFELPSAAHSLWKLPPADTPSEAEWINPWPPPVGKSYAGTIGLWLALAVLGAFLSQSDRSLGFARIWMPIALVALGLSIRTLAPVLKVAVSASASRESLTARTPWRRIALKWEGITWAEWSIDGGMAISRGFFPFRIPLKFGDQKARVLILAIIKHLREREDPLLVPLGPLVSMQTAIEDTVSRGYNPDS